MKQSNINCLLYCALAFYLLWQLTTSSTKFQECKKNGSTNGKTWNRCEETSIWYVLCYNYVIFHIRVPWNVPRFIKGKKSNLCWSNEGKYYVKGWRDWKRDKNKPSGESYQHWEVQPDVCKLLEVSVSSIFVITIHENNTFFAGIGAACCQHTAMNLIGQPPLKGLSSSRL